MDEAHTQLPKGLREARRRLDVPRCDCDDTRRERVQARSTVQACLLRIIVSCRTLMRGVNRRCNNTTGFTAICTWESQPWTLLTTAWQSDGFGRQFFKQFFSFLCSQRMGTSLDFLDIEWRRADTSAVAFANSSRHGHFSKLFSLQYLIRTPICTLPTQSHSVVFAQRLGLKYQHK